MPFLCCLFFPSINHHSSQRSFQTTLFLSSLLLWHLLTSSSLLHNSLDHLLFLNQESSHNLISNSICRHAATISSVDGLLGLGHRGVLARTQGNDTGQGGTSDTTLGTGTSLLGVVVHEVAAGRLDDFDAVGAGVV